MDFLWIFVDFLWIFLWIFCVFFLDFLWVFCDRQMCVFGSTIVLGHGFKASLAGVQERVTELHSTVLISGTTWLDLTA